VNAMVPANVPMVLLATIVVVPHALSTVTIRILRSVVIAMARVNASQDFTVNRVNAKIARIHV